MFLAMSMNVVDAYCVRLVDFFLVVSSFISTLFHSGLNIFIGCSFSMARENDLCGIFECERTKYDRV